jgi:hypothetical protein
LEELLRTNQLYITPVFNPDFICFDRQFDDSKNEKEIALP